MAAGDKGDEWCRGVDGPHAYDIVTNPI
jgi:hypothetical protein